MIIKWKWQWKYNEDRMKWHDATTENISNEYDNNDTYKAEYK